MKTYTQEEIDQWNIGEYDTALYTHLCQWYYSPMYQYQDSAQIKAMIIYYIKRIYGDTVTIDSNIIAIKYHKIIYDLLLDRILNKRFMTIIGASPYINPYTEIDMDNLSNKTLENLLGENEVLKSEPIMEQNLNIVSIVEELFWCKKSSQQRCVTMNAKPAKDLPKIYAIVNLLYQYPIEVAIEKAIELKID